MSETQNFSVQRSLNQSESFGEQVSTSRQRTTGESGSTGFSVSTGAQSSKGGGGQTGRTATAMERRRLLTVQEVRALPRDQAVVFIERGPGVLVRKMHFHRNPALLLRIVQARLALA